MLAFIDKMLESYALYQKDRAEEIVREGDGRIFTIIASALFYFLDRALDLVLPIVGLLSVMTMAFPPAALISIGVFVLAFIVILTVNHTLNYINNLKTLKQDAQDVENTECQLVQLEFETMQIYDEIEALQLQLGMTKTKAAKPALVTPTPTPEPEPNNQGFISQALNTFHMAMVALLTAARGAFVGILNLNNIFENVLRVYGVVKLVLISVFLIPFFPLVALIGIAKMCFVTPVENYIQEINAQKAKQPDLLKTAQDAKALALKEKELLECKLQVKLAQESSDIPVVLKPVLVMGMQQGTVLPLDTLPQSSTVARLA